ncbi:MAG: hypothetical protein CL678_05300 [Bdellovibrionaceae bacterium]|nr:hypothetical protein [Pseudobdellovibrionaceae bacterium]|tara:strand:- start:2111 stop:2572 length:462 start_codon:yes stop_codon:yes gene_type:complete
MEKRPDSNGNTEIHLDEKIDDSTNFQEALGTPDGNIILYCGEVKRINSVGIRNWIQYFSKLTSAGKTLTLKECSFAIVQQINDVKGFTCNGTVESIYLPFVCSETGDEIQILKTVQELSVPGYDVNAETCAECPGELEFDDIEEEYFHFLKRG